MNANDPNVALLEVVAEHLGDNLREQLVFVGGAVAGLLAQRAFRDSLPGHFSGDAASQERLPDLLHKLHELAGLALP